MPTVRQRQIAKRIRFELSDLLLREAKDPRLALVTITDVTIDRELAYAEIYVGAMGAQDRRREVMDALQHAQGYLRHEVGARVRLRRTPELRFHWDPSLEHGERISQLLDMLKEEEE